MSTGAASARPTVYIVGAFRFPDGDAAAARVLGTGRALRDAGARVTFGGWEKEGRREDVLADGTYKFDNLSYCSQGDIRHSHRSQVRRLIGAIFSGNNTLRWLAKRPMQPGTVIIAYQGGSWFISRLRQLCRTRNLRLILDLTEWYAPQQLPGGYFSPVWWDSEIGMRFVKPAVGRMIVVSSYLEKYYTSKGCDVLRTPPLIDLKDPRWACKDPIALPPSPLKIAYAGTPGRKDLLINILRGLVALGRGKEAVVVNMFGPTRESLAQTVPETAQLLGFLGEQVVFHERVPQSDVPGKLMESHFTVLIRPLERYARAGFPTKVVESLGAGVPVIANPTSDLSTYIQDGREGILLEDASPEALASGLRRVMNLGPSAWASMRKAARERAETSFDYRCYVEPMRRFVLSEP